MTIGGIVLVRQRPGTGNAIFMTLEDETGIANTILWPRKFEQYRPIVMGARLVSVTGVLQNEKGVIHIVADHFEDLTHLLGRLSEHGARIDTSMPPDAIKRPVVFAPAPSALGRCAGDDAEGGHGRCRKSGRPAHRRGHAEGPQLPLKLTSPASARRRPSPT